MVLEHHGEVALLHGQHHEGDGVARRQSQAHRDDGTRSRARQEKGRAGGKVGWQSHDLQCHRSRMAGQTDRVDGDGRGQGRARAQGEPQLTKPPTGLPDRAGEDDHADPNGQG
jgi:hypothetical protein